MLRSRKYIFSFFIMIVLILIVVIEELERQDNLAKEFANSQMFQILSNENSLSNLGFPKKLLTSIFKIVDTNYTFTQWEVIFSFEKGGYAQVYIKPKYFFIVPLFNFKKDFEIDYISYVENE